MCDPGIACADLLQVAPTYSNTHSIMNAALKLTLAGDSKAPPNDGAAAGAASQSAPTVISAARLVFGYTGIAGARVTRRALGAEKALAGGWGPWCVGG